MSTQVVKITDLNAEGVIDLLERLLADARAGKVRAVGVAWEGQDGNSTHEAAFGKFADRAAMVGRLHVLAQHITLNELLVWRPGD